MTKHPFRHGTAAHVPRADEKDGFALSHWSEASNVHTNRRRIKSGAGEKRLRSFLLQNPLPQASFMVRVLDADSALEMQCSGLYDKGLDLPFPSRELAPLFRFALMLTGDQAVAENVVLQACAHCGPHLDSYRTPASRSACLLVTVRERCLKEKRPSDPEPLDQTPALAENLLLAQKISTIPEPERSALALFYLRVLPAREIAALLKMSLEDLAKALAKGRERLERETGVLMQDHSTSAAS
jgi:DNA-directed RNA polymerase specialized sigma24 family protein